MINPSKTILVLTPGRVGSNSVARRIQSGLPGFKVIHLHTFCRDTGHLLPPADAACDYQLHAYDPSHDATMQEISELASAGSCNWNVLTIVREPIARAVSAWRAFHDSKGNFAQDYNHFAIDGWWGRQMSFILNQYSMHRWRALAGGVWMAEEARSSVALIRYEDIEGSVVPAVAALTGLVMPPMVLEHLNPSEPKSPPSIPWDLAIQLQSSFFSQALYTPHELAEARDEWVSK